MPFNLVIFLILYFVIRPRKRFDGQVFWSFGVLYAIARAAIEFFRDDDRGILFGVLSTSQLIGIGLLALSLFMLHRLRKASLERGDPAADAPA